MKQRIQFFSFFLAIFASSFGIAQTRVVHISDFPADKQLEQYADVEGYLLISTDAEPKQINPFRDGYNVVDGWPVVKTGFSSRGGTYGNLDDDPELELIYNISTKTYALNPDGSDVAGWPVSVSSSAEYGAPAYGDINGDGYDDVVVSCRQPGTGNTGKIYAFNRDGSPVEGFPLTPDGGPTRTPVLADLDLDGALEIIVELRKYPDGYICVYNGDGTVREGWPQLMDYIPASAVAVGDITGDEIPEIVGESYYKVWAFDASGMVINGFPYAPASTDRTFSYSSPVLADVDGDGFREIIVGDHALSAGNGAVHIIKNNGSPLAGWPRFASQWIYGPASVADIDSDGDLDIAVGDQVLSGTPADYVYAWDVNDGMLDGFPIGPLWAVNSQIVVADLDGDEMMELCFDDNTGNGILNGYNHDGTLTEGWPLTVEGSTFFTNPMLLDATGDFLINLSASSGISSTSEIRLYLWESNFMFNSDLAPLPMLQYNVRHSGVYGEINNPVVNINENSRAKKARLICSPNPCHDQTLVNIPDDCTGIHPLQVFDAKGSLIQKIEFTGSRTIKIPTSNLKEGMYLIWVQNDLGETYQTKFIKAGHH